MAMIARSWEQVMAREFTSRGTPEEVYRDALNVASAIYNRSLATGAPLNDIVANQQQFNAYGKVMKPGDAERIAIAKQAMEQVMREGPVHDGTYFATPNADGNLPRGLQLVAEGPHNVYRDPQARPIIVKNRALPVNQEAITQAVAGSAVDAPVPEGRPAAPVSASAAASLMSAPTEAEATVSLRPEVAAMAPAPQPGLQWSGATASMDPTSILDRGIPTVGDPLIDTAQRMSNVSSNIPNGNLISAAVPKLIEGYSTTYLKEDPVDFDVEKTDRMTPGVEKSARIPGIQTMQERMARAVALQPGQLEAAQARLNGTPALDALGAVQRSIPNENLSVKTDRGTPETGKTGRLPGPAVLQDRMAQPGMLDPGQLEAAQARLNGTSPALDVMGAIARSPAPDGDMGITARTDTNMTVDNRPYGTPGPISTPLTDRIDAASLNSIMSDIAARQAMAAQQVPTSVAPAVSTEPSEATTSMNGADGLSPEGAQAYRTALASIQSVASDGVPPGKSNAQLFGPSLLGATSVLSSSGVDSTTRRAINADGTYGDKVTNRIGAQPSIDPPALQQSAITPNPALGNLSFADPVAPSFEDRRTAEATQPALDITGAIERARGLTDDSLSGDLPDGISLDTGDYTGRIGATSMFDENGNMVGQDIIGEETAAPKLDAPGTDINTDMLPSEDQETVVTGPVDTSDIEKTREEAAKPAKSNTAKNAIGGGLIGAGIGGLPGALIGGLGGLLFGDKIRDMLGGTEDESLSDVTPLGKLMKAISESSASGLMPGQAISLNNIGGGLANVQSIYGGAPLGTQASTNNGGLVTALGGGKTAYTNSYGVTTITGPDGKQMSDWSGRTGADYGWTKE